MVLDTRTILSSATTHLNHTMLLNIVALARNDSGNDLARTQAHTSNLALARVGLLGLCDTGLETHALQRRVVLQRRRPATPRALALAAATSNLVVGCADYGGAGELPGQGGEGECGLRAEDGLEGEAAWTRGLAGQGGGGQGAEGG